MGAQDKEGNVNISSNLDRTKREYEIRAQVFLEKKQLPAGSTHCLCPQQHSSGKKQGHEEHGENPTYSHIGRNEFILPKKVKVIKVPSPLPSLRDHEAL